MVEAPSVAVNIFTINDILTLATNSTSPQIQHKMHIQGSDYDALIRCHDCTILSL